MSLIAFIPLAAVIGWTTWVLRRRRGEGLGLPAIAIVSFGYLYIIQPVYMMQTGDIEIFLNDRQVLKGVLVPSVMLLAFVFGWIRVRDKYARDAQKKFGEPRSVIWNFGCVIAFGGGTLYAIFIGRSGGFEQAFSAPHGGGMAWEENTAYLYMGPWWMLSGVAMMMLSSFRAPWVMWRRMIPIGLLCALYVNAILLSSRGMTFAITATLVVSFGLARGASFRLSQAVWFLLPACVIALLMVGFRSVLYIGDDKPASPELADAITSTMRSDTVHRALATTGIEFIYHASILDTVDDRQKYDCGLSWLYTFTVQPIPRILWEGKPVHYEPVGITSDDIYESTGLRVAAGAAGGIVADLYWHFGVFSIVFFYGFGYYSRRLFVRAQRGDSTLCSTSYILLFALGLNCFAQGFGAIVVPLPFALAPAMVFHVVFSQRAGRLPRIPMHSLRRSMNKGCSESRYLGVGNTPNG